jgi:hypothetical protein
MSRVFFASQACSLDLLHRVALVVVLLSMEGCPSHLPKLEPSDGSSESSSEGSGYTGTENTSSFDATSSTSEEDATRYYYTPDLDYDAVGFRCAMAASVAK